MHHKAPRSCPATCIAKHFRLRGFSSTWLRPVEGEVQEARAGWKGSKGKKGSLALDRLLALRKSAPVLPAAFTYIFEAFACPSLLLPLSLFGLNSVLCFQLLSKPTVLVGESAADCMNAGSPGISLWSIFLVDGGPSDAFSLSGGSIRVELGCARVGTIIPGVREYTWRAPPITHEHKLPINAGYVLPTAKLWAIYNY